MLDLGVNLQLTLREFFYYLTDFSNILLESSAIEKIYILFLGKSVELPAEGLQGLESQEYIRQKLGENDRGSSGFLVKIV